MFIASLARYTETGSLAIVFIFMKGVEILKISHTYALNIRLYHTKFSWWLRYLFRADDENALLNEMNISYLICNNWLRDAMTIIFY